MHSSVPRSPSLCLLRLCLSLTLSVPLRLSLFRFLMKNRRPKVRPFPTPPVRSNLHRFPGTLPFHEPGNVQRRSRNRTALPGFRRPLSCLSPVRSRNLRSFHAPDPARGSRGARRGLETQDACCASASSQAGLGAALGSGRDWNDADAGRFPDGGGCADFQTTETQSP